MQGKKEGREREDPDGLVAASRATRWLIIDRLKRMKEEDEDEVGISSRRTARDIEI